MNRTVAGWLSVFGAGATGAAGVIVAGPLTKQTAIVAALTFVGVMGAAARALYSPKPVKSPPPVPTP
jgi:preprotein translocase subunit SecG